MNTSFQKTLFGFLIDSPDFLRDIGQPRGTPIAPNVRRPLHSTADAARATTLKSTGQDGAGWVVFQIVHWTCSEVERGALGGWISNVLLQIPLPAGAFLAPRLVPLRLVCRLALCNARFEGEVTPRHRWGGRNTPSFARHSTAVRLF